VSAAERFGAPVQIRISQLSIFNQPPKRRIMAVIKGYFDDSQTTGQLWAVAGYLGDDQSWAQYEALWPLVLATHEVPYFHRREMSDPNGAFKKWYPAPEHEAELAAFQADLAKVIGQSGLKAFGSIVRIRDLNRFNAEHQLNLEPYSLAAYGCMLIIGKEHVGEPVELIFDHVEKVTSKLATAQEYADADRYYGPDGVFKKIALTGLPEELTAKEVIAIQAADFWVWEWRKHQLKIDGWHESMGQPEDWDARWVHMQQWMAQKFSKEVMLRKSAKALLERAKFLGLIWDYKNLCDAHKARDEIWSQVSSGRRKSS
jgi:hypothetical protein